VHVRGKLKLVKKKALKNEKELRFHPAKDVLDVWTGNWADVAYHSVISYKCNLQVQLLFLTSETIATLTLYYTGKSFIKLTPGC